MDIDFHSDPLAREELFVSYLTRRIDPTVAESLEVHYLECDECFVELFASEALRNALERSGLVFRREGDVLVMGFATPAYLTRESTASRELLEGILEHNDSKVLIDLSRVSRIDSAGLGLLMNCYSHALRNRGMLKVLKPSESVRKLLQLTRLTTVLETFDEEYRAIESFANQERNSQVSG
jgi:anti-sigma B factor antagonist